MVLDIFTSPHRYFLQTAGLFALLSLAYLLLLYLIKPKPKEVTIPSLMFFFRDSGKSKLNQFFQTILRNILLILQLLALLALSLAIAKPYVNLDSEIASKNTVLIVDTSASMQTLMGSNTRFENAIEIAKNEVGSRNTIILIKNIPEVISEKEDAETTISILEGLRPVDTPSTIYDSIIQSLNYAKENDRVVIISDFIETETDSDYAAAIRTLEAKGIIVESKSVFKSAENIGIIDLDLDDETSKVTIKNYFSTDKTVTVTIGAESQEFEIPAGSIEIARFTTPGGRNTVKLEPNDDFPLDNTAFISAPEKRVLPTLIITNSENPYLTTALSLLDELQIEVQEPPKTDINHPIIIVSNVDKNLILPGTFKDIKEAVQDGASLIIMGQPDIFQLPWRGLLPVSYLDTLDFAAVLKTQDFSFTKDIEFGTTKNYHQTELVHDATVIAQGNEDTPFIVLESLKNGYVFYYGLVDENSDFPRDPQYPLFWKRVIEFLTGKQDIKSMNFDTSKIMSFDEKVEVATPLQTIESSVIPLSHAGFYTMDDITYSSNLLNEKESNVNLQAETTRLKTTTSEKSNQQLPVEYTKYFIIAATILILLELLYVKSRGDI